MFRGKSKGKSSSASQQQQQQQQQTPADPRLQQLQQQQQQLEKQQMHTRAALAHQLVKGQKAQRVSISQVQQHQQSQHRLMQQQVLQTYKPSDTAHKADGKRLGRKVSQKQQQAHRQQQQQILLLQKQQQEQRLKQQQIQQQIAMQRRMSNTAASTATASKTQQQATLASSQSSQDAAETEGKHHIPVDTLVVALYAYTARTPNELTFAKGDRFTITNSENPNWWEAIPESGKGELGWVPSNYVEEVNSLDVEPWFHGKIPRTTAEFFLINGINGSYLVRESQSTPGEHTISLRCDGKVFHYRISRSDKGVWIANDRVFPTMQKLIDFYHSQSDGLVHPLRHAVPKKRQVAESGPTDEWEIDRAGIIMGKRLGAGQYGEVYDAVLKQGHKRVAVKTLKEGSMDADDFLKEAEVMKKLKHQHLVELIGVCTLETPLYIVTEFMVNGCLLDYLRDPIKQKEITPTAMMYIAEQISSGMRFLEQHNFIHRDLAARNCLVGENLLVKLADFGLARLLRQQENEYEAKAGAKFPIKWTAPESLNYNIFSTKSDVWAFGITLWEIVTFGAVPYPGMDLFTVLDKLQEQYRMPRPDGCPVEIYQLMLACWEEDPKERPSFRDIHGRITHMYEGTSVEEEVSKTKTLEKGISMEAVKAFMQDEIGVGSSDPGTGKKADTHNATASMQPEEKGVDSTKTSTDEDAQEQGTTEGGTTLSSVEKHDIDTLTKRIVKQAHHIIKSGDAIELDSALGTLVSDVASVSALLGLVACESGGHIQTAWETLNMANSEMTTTIMELSESPEARKTLYLKVRELAKQVVFLSKMVE